MERYEKNGFCEYLKAHPEKHMIKFYDTEKSLLVIANKRNNQPIMLIIDDRVSKEEYEEELNQYEKDFGNTCFLLAQKSKLPLFWIRYIDKDILTNEDEISLWESDNKKGVFSKVKMKSLVDVFLKHNIQAELENRTPEKRKNDSLSSAFHIWQRECLKVGIFADLDLIRMTDDGQQVMEIIELKRSFYKLNQWRPFYFDINNFAIVSNFCELLGSVPFRIIYNEQVTKIPESTDRRLLEYYYKLDKKNRNNEEYYDKIDIVKVFEVNRKEDVYFYTLPYPELIGEIAIDEYIDKDRNKYLGKAES